jgi:hypothetical protein
MKLYAASLLALFACVGCGRADAPSQAQASAGSDSAATSARAAISRDDTKNEPGLPGRTEELAQPDAAAMVFLYHELAQIPLPIDAMIERDSRVSMARPIDKAAAREQVRSELEAGLRAVARVGFLRMPLNAGLSDYDPTYQEFTVQAFAPSSVFSFSALGEQVTLKFRNAREAQTWQVAAADAQSIRDKLGYGGATADALLKIVGVQPGPGGGVIVADVIEYDIRSSRGGQRLGHLKVAAQ